MGKQLAGESTLDGSLGVSLARADTLASSGDEQDSAVPCKEGIPELREVASGSMGVVGDSLEVGADSHMEIGASLLGGLVDMEIHVHEDGLDADAGAPCMDVEVEDSASGLEGGALGLGLSELLE